jgi:hypothetical protein
MPRIATFRALSYVFAKRIVVLTGWVLLAIALLLLIGIIALGQYVSSWWLLLLVPFVLCLVLGLAILGLARFIVARLYPQPLTVAQKRSLSSFNDKIMHLIEARSIPPFMLAGIVIKDLIVHREMKTLRNLVDNSRSLKKDFAQLEEDLNDSGPQRPS